MARMQNSWEPDFFIADWRVCPALGKLERGEDSVPIEPRTMQFLSCLARHAPDVVSKQRLIREVWGEAFVTDEVLSHSVWELRKVFGDEARKPRYIQTLARKGYRLVAEVSRYMSPELLTPGSRIGQYEILEPLAGGAMGEVYKAKDTRLGRTVALKFLPVDLCRDLNARKRFLREAQVVAQLDHPHVATIYDTGETEGGRVYLALAFYEGETLQQKLERGPLPIPEAVNIARQVARGLAAAHRRQIVHRDIKPANLVVLPDGMVRILDFGLAKLTGATTLTRLGTSPGTPAYKSPEQTRGEKVDPRSDLWALGVVLYEMVTGRVPFGGEYEQALIYSILNQPLPSMDGLPADLTVVIRGALEKNAVARYQTAEEMEADLAAIPLEGGGGAAAQQKPSWTRLPVQRRCGKVLLFARRRWLIIIRSALTAFIVALGFWWYSRDARRELEVAKYVDLGEQLEWRGDSEGLLGHAEEAYRRALALDPENSVVMAQLAALLTRIQIQFPTEARLAEIRQLTDRAVVHEPDHAMPWLAKAKLLLLENKPEEAERAARNAIDRDPDFDRAYTVLGEALILLGQEKEGLEEIKHGTEVGKGYLRSRLVYASRLRQAGRYNEAASEFRKVLDLDPNHPTALHNLGDVYVQIGREADAVTAFRRAWDMNGDPRSANSLGNLFLKMGRERDAIEYFTNAYNVKPYPTLARNLAEAYEKLGQANEARRWYKIALEGFDKQLAQGGPKADSLYGRSFCLAKLGRFDEAFADIQEAMKLKPNENRFLKRAAQIYFLAGRREEGFDYVRRAIQAGLSRDEIVNDFVFQDYLDDPEFRAILEGN